MGRFWEWLLDERRQELVPQEVLRGYEQGFKHALVQLLGTMQNPVLRAKFQQMLDCPITDARGRCRTFTEYIVSALARHNIHRQTDIEDALAYVYQTMMFDRKTTGEPKATVFGSFNPDRPGSAEGNPLEARFKVAVANAIRNITGGRVPRLFNTERRPQGTRSIGQGRTKQGEPPGTISPDEIADRSDRGGDLGILVADIKSLLRQKEKAYGLPLVAIFDAIMAGQRLPEQRQRFGFKATGMARQVIVGTIRDYAKSSGDHYLLQLLGRLEEPGETPTPSAQPARTAAPSTKNKDYASILSVIDRLGRPAGNADLGRYRRKWLEYAPRDAGSGHRNRMEEVLSQMVRDGVLRAVQTGRGATAYVPGANAGQYRVVAAA